MTVMSFDYNPLLAWLANLGYVVCVPNFRGSTGFGVDHMDAVLGDGCLVVELVTFNFFGVVYSPHNPKG